LVHQRSAARGPPSSHPHPPATVGGNTGRSLHFPPFPILLIARSLVLAHTLIASSKVNMAYQPTQDVAMYAGVLPQVSPDVCAPGCAPCSSAAAGRGHPRGQMWGSSVEAFAAVANSAQDLAPPESAPGYCAGNLGPMITRSCCSGSSCEHARPAVVLCIHALTTLPCCSS
jgi:hypothetical protein